MKNIAVVVPNWNGKNSIKECLDSLAKQSTKCSLIVVDNASTDGSLELIKDKYPGCAGKKHQKPRFCRWCKYWN
jgi:glycosyltransferase involved in cell wall biosynthesis